MIYSVKNTDLIVDLTKINSIAIIVVVYNNSRRRVPKSN